MKDLMMRIRFQLPSLPRAERVVAEALLENPEAISVLTLAQLAKETGSSDASIIRFCRRMGFKGYTDFKTAFICRRDLSEEDEEKENQDSMMVILKKVFKGNMQTLTDTVSLATTNYDEALNAMVNAKSIHFFGVGDAYAVCQLAHMKISRLGISGTAYSDVTQQLVAAANIKPEDVAFSVSYEGRSRNVVEAMKIAKERGAVTICITKMNKSPLLHYVDIALFISVSDLTIGREKVARRVADQAILDALFVGMSIRMGKEAIKKRQDIHKVMEINKIRKKS